MNRSQIALVLAVALVGGLAGAWTARHLHREPAEAARDAALRAVAPGSPVPAFRFPGPDGTPVGPGDFPDRALLINFWATWCPPCLREMPALGEVHEAVAARGGTVLGVALDDAEAVRGFLAERAVAYPVAIAEGPEGTRLGARLGNPSGLLPFSVFVDRAGRIADIHVGELDAAQARARLEPLLDQRPEPKR